MINIYKKNISLYTFWLKCPNTNDYNRRLLALLKRGLQLNKIQHEFRDTRVETVYFIHQLKILLKYYNGTMRKRFKTALMFSERGEDATG